MDFWVFLQAYRRALEGAGRNYISLKLVFSLSPRSSHSRLSSPDSHLVFRITWKPLCVSLHDHLFFYSPSLKHATPQLVKFTGFILCETLCGLQCWLASWEPLPSGFDPWSQAASLLHLCCVLRLGSSSDSDFSSKPLPSSGGLYIQHGLWHLTLMFFSSEKCTWFSSVWSMSMLPSPLLNA